MSGMVAKGAVLANLRRGALEYCILALLRPGPRYGLEIARELTRDGVLMGGEGTLYPLLARLRKSGLVETTWQESTTGPPRRYYALTNAGQTALATFVDTWRAFSDAVDAVLDPDEPS
ncbi:PadR family transcriptional regulator [Bogoriella caseilytica]|uniref:PadR family transcriptional regulator n=1 Tax=Bogoriella caseilytica TaxID=56055 RepID=A0A3N2BFW8_9MICO|nr:PadR family transcriptional regulator [Bogoriella caseilytica]